MKEQLLHRRKKPYDFRYLHRIIADGARLLLRMTYFKSR